MLESFSLREGPGPRLVTEQYVNEDAGFQLKLPHQWQGIEIITDENTIFLSYGAASQVAFEKYLPLFEKTLETLQIENDLNLSDASIMAEAYDSRLTSKSVLQQGVEKEIIILSKSELHTFSFIDSSNSIIITPRGIGGSLIDSTTVYVNDLLHPPFKVTIDGIVLDDFLVVEDRTNGDVSIGFGYEHPVNEIKIIGSEKKSDVFDEKDSESQIDPPSLQLDTGPAESTQIPDWIRNNAEWWAQGAIGDSDFVSGIQYLIKEGIMQIPETAKASTSSGSEEIPAWIKNNADWWAQGLISDDDFVKGIQYLVEQGIMVV